MYYCCTTAAILKQCCYIIALSHWCERRNIAWLQIILHKIIVHIIQIMSVMMLQLSSCMSDIISSISCDQIIFHITWPNHVRHTMWLLMCFWLCTVLVRGFLWSLFLTFPWFIYKTNILRTKKWVPCIYCHICTLPCQFMMKLKDHSLSNLPLFLIAMLWKAGWKEADFLAMMWLKWSFQKT